MREGVAVAAVEVEEVAAMAWRLMVPNRLMSSENDSSLSFPLALLGSVARAPATGAVGDASVEAEELCAAATSPTHSALATAACALDALGRGLDSGDSRLPAPATAALLRGATGDSEFTSRRRSVTGVRSACRLLPAAADA
ncbi:hypothetical protein EON62_03560 [archaeon]|nr:MAG: hypothetical protein EON62_03560 [archaeon]